MTEYDKVQGARASVVLFCAEMLMSKSMRGSHFNALLNIAPNPYKQGRLNQIAMWEDNYRSLSSDLIWC